MTFKRSFASVASLAFVLSIATTSAASALTTSCVGAPSTSAITWTASSAGGVAPIVFLWGNGSTSSAQTVAATPGTYSMTLQATDASSTVATTTCSATVAQPAAPTITSLVATPSTITAGQNSILSWTVNNASSTSLNNNIGTVTGTSVTVTPTMTSTYTLSAVNPNGTTTQSVTVTVNATSTTGTNIQGQIQNLLNQITMLKAQIMQLLLKQTGGATGGIATSTAATSTASGYCFKFNRDLSRGDDGDDVRELQRTLANDPSILPPGLVTGFFGHRTEEALRKFQRKFGLNAAGFFGPMTRDLVRGHCGSDDNDRDGITNSVDTDDDNDGIIDTEDSHPLRSDKASTTTPKFSPKTDGENHGKKDKGDSNDD